MIPLFQTKTIHDLLLILDLVGTFVFAVSGAMMGVRHKLDIFGVLVVAFVSSNAGGIIRDVLIGAVPPAGISDWRYPVVAISAGVSAFFGFPRIAKLTTPINVVDAVGLALFAVAGAQKALAYGVNPLMSALLGMLTGVGGGMVRDLLLTRTPAVLHSDLYAVAALSGAGVVVIGTQWHCPAVPLALAAALICFAMRMVAMQHNLQLPISPFVEGETSPPD